MMKRDHVRVQDVFHDEIRDGVAYSVQPSPNPRGYMEEGYFQISILSFLSARRIVLVAFAFSSLLFFGSGL